MKPSKPKSAQKRPTVSDLVERAGKLQAQLEKLNTEHEEICSTLRALGSGIYGSPHFEAQVLQFTRATTDWKKIAAVLGFSHQLRTAHTKKQKITRVVITSRNAAGTKRASIKRKSKGL